MASQTEQELLAGRYRKLDTIGVGGMARVLLAEDERLGRRVAVKRLHSDSPEEAAERFEREARLGASLNHPNLVSIFDIAADGESVLIVMEYVEGQTLGDEIAQGPLRADAALDILEDVAAALDHAHAHGVVHRDVKPANILLRADGTAKLADLGIATAAENTRITRSGVVLGTASYMAPEQLDGRPAGPAADVYSLATVAFEALTGHKARAGSSPMEIAHRVISDPPPDLRESWPDAPAKAAETLMRAMARRPEDRPGSAGELVAELRRALASRSRPVRRPAAAPRADGQPRAPVPAVSPRASARRASARSRRGAPSWLPAAAVLAAFCAVGAIVLAPTGGDDGSDRARRSDSGSKDAPAARRQTAKADGGSGGPAPTPAGGAASGGGGAQGGSAGGGVALNARGYRLMQAGRYDEAIPLLQRAVNVYPAGSKDLTYAYALYNLGRSLRLAGRADEAVPILERRLQIPNQTATVRRELEAARKAAR